MRTASIISALLHVAVIGFMYAGLPLFDDPPLLTETPIIEVEFEDVAEVTNAVEPEQEPEAEPPKQEAAPAPEPPPPPPRLEPTPTQPVQPDAVALPKEFAEAPEPEPEAEPEPEPAEEQVAVVTPLPKRRPAVATKSPPEPAKEVSEEPAKETFDASRIAALLDKTPDDKPKKKQQTIRDLLENTPTAAAGTSTGSAPLTISEKDRIKLHIIRNWNPNRGAAGADKMLVKIRIYLRADGSISQRPEVIEEFRANQSEQVFRPFAESAVRAVLKSNPLPVPPGKYESWKQIDFTFSLKDMLG